MLADLVGDRRLAIAGGVNGRLSEAQVFTMYSNLGGRYQWAAGVQQSPYFFLNNYTTDFAAPFLLQQQVIARFIARNAFAIGLYPINRFTRFEYGASFNNIDRSLMFVSNISDIGTGQSTGWFIDSIVNAASMNYASPYVAYVSDNALMGATGGIYGRRYRFQIEQTAGNVNWMSYSNRVKRLIG